MISIAKQMESEIYEYAINYNKEDRKKLVSYITVIFPKLYYENAFNKEEELLAGICAI